MRIKKHNDVLILGVLFLLLGVGMLLLDGNVKLFSGRQSDEFGSSPGRIVLLRDAEGEVLGFTEIGAGDRIDYKAMNESQGYVFDFSNALTILFFTAGGLLLLASGIKVRSKRSY